MKKNDKEMPKTTIKKKIQQQKIPKSTENLLEMDRQKKQTKYEMNTTN